MSFSNFMLKGVDNDNKRDGIYPPDSIEAKEKSSFSYKGRVTKKNSYEITKTVEIDDAVKYTTVSDDIRKQSQDLLNSHQNKAIFTGVIGVGGIGYSLYKIVDGYKNSGIAGASLGLGLSLLSLYRGCEAYDESQKWKDQTIDICLTRKNLAADFNTLMKLDLREKIYTIDETKHIFHETVRDSETKHESIIIEGNTINIEKWVECFIKNNNPFRSSGLTYAFGNQAIIENPIEPNDGNWDRKDFDNLVLKSNHLAQQFSLFKSVKESKIKKVENLGAIESVGIQTTNVLGDKYLERSAHDTLDIHKKNMDEKLKNLKAHKKLLDETNYKKQKQAIKDEYKKNHIQTANRLDDNKNIKNIVAFGGTSLLTLFNAGQKNDIISENRNSVIEKTTPIISEIFADYKRSRNRM